MELRDNLEKLDAAIYAERAHVDVLEAIKTVALSFENAVINYRLAQLELSAPVNFARTSARYEDLRRDMNSRRQTALDGLFELSRLVTEWRVEARATHHAVDKKFERHRRIADA